MRRKKHFIIGLFCLLFCMISSYLPTEAHNDLSQKAVSENKTQKTTTGWFKKGNHQYYRSKNGKLCKKSWVKIGKHFYSFDANGRMKKGIVKLNRSYSGYFSSKTGRFVYNVVDLKIAQIGSNSVIGKNEHGDLFSIPFKNTKWVNKKGKTVKKLEIRENETIRVCFKGSIKEISPGEFVNIVKVQVK